jgi:uncharacterized membrane protein
VTPVTSQQNHHVEVTTERVQMEPQNRARGNKSVFFCGLAMVLFSALRIHHFFEANYQVMYGWRGSMCDVGSWLNCNNFDYSVLAQIGSIPLGYFGLMVGGLFCMGGLFPSSAIERTNRMIALGNVGAVAVLFSYSVFSLRSLCLWDAGYYLFSIAALVVMQRRIVGDGQSFRRNWLRPSFKYLATFLVIFSVGAYSVRMLQRAKRQANFVAQYFSLPTVQLPSKISPYWPIQSTAKFQDATIRVVEYSDLICDNSKYLNEALQRLNKDFPGKMNVAFQFFPLETKCNHVVDKNKHPGACESALIAAYDPAKFRAIHDDFFHNYYDAQKPEWRRALADRYGVSAAFTDPQTEQTVQELIQTGSEYPPTSDIYPYGIRSVPTVILNERMIIGSLTYDQFRLICQAIIDKQNDKRQFVESWYDRTNDLMSWLFRVLKIVT